jgi:TPR repeat protein
VNFGGCLVNDDGVDQDWIRAAEYYRLSAEQKNSRGQFLFGICLVNGDGA